MNHVNKVFTVHKMTELNKTTLIKIRLKIGDLIVVI